MGSFYFGGALFAHLHTICTWALFISEVRFAAHLRDICTVFTNVYEHWTWALFISEVRFSNASIRSAQFLQITYAFWRCARLGDFIILNKGPMPPPWRKKAQGSHAQRWVQNFNPILFPTPGLRILIRLSQNLTTNLHQSDSDRCRSKYGLKISTFIMENVYFHVI